MDDEKVVKFKTTKFKMADKEIRELKKINQEYIANLKSRLSLKKAQLEVDKQKIERLEARIASEVRE